MPEAAYIPADKWQRMTKMAMDNEGLSQEQADAKVRDFYASKGLQAEPQTQDPLVAKYNNLLNISLQNGEPREVAAQKVNSFFEKKGYKIPDAVTPQQPGILSRMWKAAAPTLAEIGKYGVLTESGYQGDPNETDEQRKAKGEAAAAVAGPLFDVAVPEWTAAQTAFGAAKGLTKGLASGEDVVGSLKRAGRAALGESSLGTMIGEATGIPTEQVLATKELGIDKKEIPFGHMAGMALGLPFGAGDVSLGTVESLAAPFVPYAGLSKAGKAIGGAVERSLSKDIMGVPARWQTDLLTKSGELPSRVVPEGLTKEIQTLALSDNADALLEKLRQVEEISPSRANALLDRYTSPEFQSYLEKLQGGGATGVEAAYKPVSETRSEMQRLVANLNDAMAAKDANRSWQTMDAIERLGRVPTSLKERLRSELENSGLQEIGSPDETRLLQARLRGEVPPTTPPASPVQSWLENRPTTPGTMARVEAPPPEAPRPDLNLEAQQTLLPATPVMPKPLKDTRREILGDNYDKWVSDNDLVNNDRAWQLATKSRNEIEAGLTPEQIAALEGNPAKMAAENRPAGEVFAEMQKKKTPFVESDYSIAGRARGRLEGNPDDIDALKILGDKRYAPNDYIGYKKRYDRLIAEQVPKELSFNFGANADLANMSPGDIKQMIADALKSGDKQKANRLVEFMRSEEGALKLRNPQAQPPKYTIPQIEKDIDGLVYNPDNPVKDFESYVEVRQQLADSITATKSGRDRQAILSLFDERFPDFAIKANKLKLNEPMNLLEAPIKGVAPEVGPYKKNFEPTSPEDIDMARISMTTENQAEHAALQVEAMNQNERATRPTFTEGTKEGLINSIRWVKKNFRPQMLSEQADSAAGKVVSMLGGKARKLEQMDYITGEAGNYFNKVDRVGQLEFLGKYQRGEKQNTPELQLLDQLFRGIFKSYAERIAQEAPEAVQGFLENYFPQYWKTVSRNGKNITRAPIEGSKDFTKGRVFEDILAGIERGYNPVTTNPVELLKMKVAEYEKFLGSRKLINDLEKEGWVYNAAKEGKKIPDGYVRINDPIMGGRLYADPDVAAVINNHLSASAYQTIGGPFSAYMKVGGMLNSAQLLGVFHGAFTTMEVPTATLALGYKQMFEGRGGDALKSFRAVLSPESSSVAQNLRRGWEFASALRTGEGSAEVLKAVEMFEKGGGQLRNRIDENAIAKVRQAYKDADAWGVAKNSPEAASQVASYLIMEKLVPTQKAGMYSMLAQDFIKSHPNATAEQLAKAGRELVDRVDSRMGQVNWDRLLMSNGWKNFIQGIMRAPGWTGGTIAELGGAVTDTLGQAGRLASKGAEKLTGGAVKSNLGAYEGMTHRQSYALALATYTGMVAGTISVSTMMLRDGMTAQQAKASLTPTDFIFPRIGGMDDNGNPNRISLPGYMKDVYAWYNDAPSTALHKLHPMLGTIGDMIKNKDYHGVQITGPDDTSTEKWGARAAYAGKQFTPFFVKGIMQQTERQGPIEGKVASVLGAPPAPSSLYATEAQKYMRERAAAEQPVGGRTQEAYDKTHTINKIAKLLDKDPKAAFAMEDQARQEGKISDRDIDAIMKAENKTPNEQLFSKLTWQSAATAYAKATPQEREVLMPLLRTKFDTAMGGANERDQDRIMAILDAIENKPDIRENEIKRYF